MTACVELAKEYRWSALVAANQALTDAYLPVERDCDFVLRGYKLIWLAPGGNNPIYLVRLSDHRGRPLANVPLRINTNQGPTAGNFNIGVGMFCKTVVPELVYPRGTKIRIEFQEINGGGPLLLKIVFVGVNRFIEG